MFGSSMSFTVRGAPSTMTFGNSSGIEAIALLFEARRCGLRPKRAATRSTGRVLHGPARDRSKPLLPSSTEGDVDVTVGEHEETCRPPLARPTADGDDRAARDALSARTRGTRPPVLVQVIRRLGVHVDVVEPGERRDRRLVLPGRSRTSAPSTTRTGSSATATRPPSASAAPTADQTSETLPARWMTAAIETRETSRRTWSSARSAEPTVGSTEARSTRPTARSVAAPRVGSTENTTRRTSRRTSCRSAPPDDDRGDDGDERARQDRCRGDPRDRRADAREERAAEHGPEDEAEQDPPDRRSDDAIPRGAQRGERLGGRRHPGSVIRGGATSNRRETPPRTRRAHRAPRDWSWRPRGCRRRSAQASSGTTLHLPARSSCPRTPKPSRASPLPPRDLMTVARGASTRRRRNPTALARRHARARSRNKRQVR